MFSRDISSISPHKLDHARLNPASRFVGGLQKMRFDVLHLVSPHGGAPV
jgi:hypothetical protein